MSLLSLIATAEGEPIPVRPTTLDDATTTRLAAWGRVSHHKVTATSLTSTTTHVAPVEGEEIRLVWGNVTGNHTPPYAANTNTITVSATITTPSGIHPVTWSGGSSTTTINGGQIVTSDPAAGSWVHAGGNVTVTCTVTAPSGGVIPTMEGWSDGTGAYLAGPLAVLGDTPTANTKPRWLFLGDSISEGVGDTLHGRSGENGTGGYPERLATKAGVAYLNVAASGERWNQVDSTTWAARVGNTLAGRCSHVLAAYVVNDILVYTKDQLADQHAEQWGILAAVVPNVYAVTCPPRTGTDGTTVSGDPTQRNAWNAWLRDGAPVWYQSAFSRWQGRPTGDASADTVRIGQTYSGRTHPLKGILDVAAVVAATGNQNQWKSGHTTDGVHPNTTGHAAIATALSLPT